MTKLWNRLRQQAFPTWEVSDAELDPQDETRIRVKVKKPLPENSRIKIKGNAIGSGWVRMNSKYYWLGKTQYRIHQVDAEACSLLKRLHAKVRVPELEQQHANDIRKAQLEQLRKIKR
jgi:hypothetical protein